MQTDLTLTLAVISQNPAFVSRFTAIVHPSTNMDGLQLQPAFYTQHIVGSHHELELRGPDWLFETRGLHIHHADDDRPFVCYPAAMPTLAEARRIFEIWAAGAVLFKGWGIDMNDALKREECGGLTGFLGYVERVYGITVHTCDA